MATPFQLIMRSGPTPGKTFTLNKSELVIGRESTNDIVINDAEISRKHARLVQIAGGGYMIEDLGSTNGTYVNGQRLMGPHTLQPGELVMFGENINAVYEVSAPDAGATIASGQGVYAAPPPLDVANYPSSPEPPYQQAPIPPAPSVGPPEASYAQQIPAGPAVYDAPISPPRKDNRTWIFAGCGCLLILCCIVVAGGWAFDSANLYCTPPFNAFFTCP